MKLTEDFMMNALRRWLKRSTRRVNGTSKYKPHQGEQEKARRQARDAFPCHWSDR